MSEEPTRQAAPLATAGTLQPDSPPALDAASAHLAGPLLLIALLAAVALALTRRRRRPGPWIQILQTTSLGPKRALVVAQLGAETVLLASSEAGIVLIKSGLSRAEPRLAPAAPRALPTKGPPRSAHFEDYLAESAEDLELRQKVAAGQQARVA